ncbi:1-acyl-sn-glycerol-3-phosphate acyltransferase [Pelagibius sp. Alg239-R121]|uniref:lysophospholipid acyltransferase family protein n=1 Tax=Pelagibius sp. Alg239-R121 TaxID=2993448 RepID=UPI0024A6889B|nr:lysophospholipid acyltransferase family protein [Pelagibius sp. Alg239-R121]
MNMIVLRSFIFNALFFGWSTIYLTVCLPILLLPPRASSQVGKIWTRTTFALLKFICKLDYEVIGLENLPDAPFIVASKHQSAWETMVFSVLLDHPCFIMKRELNWIPLFGWFTARSGAIGIDRSGGASELKRLIALSREIVAEKRPIIIFPEGTRVPPTQQIPYQPGVAALYGQLKIPVVPVALNSGYFWRRRAFAKRPGKVTLEFLPAIPPGLPRKEFLPRLVDSIESACTRLPVPVHHDSPFGPQSTDTAEATDKAGATDNVLETAAAVPGEPKD